MSDRTPSPRLHLVVHGHFYQPPRENPWTGRIEPQAGAAPYHDWNARIAAECYAPNAAARILDAAGRVAGFVSTYASLSFNFGPTLLAWLEAEAPETYRRILAADRPDPRRGLGGGNALAQAYNHLILPLAPDRDKATQVRWGIADFVHRFGRRPAAMWLPETAADEATLRILLDHGMRFVLLSPTQVARWRPLGASAWIDAGEVAPDPRRPYRWFGRDSKGRRDPHRFLDVLLYHRPISQAVSFEGLVRDAREFAGRVAAAAADGPEDPLVLVCSDGEVYGHHERFGEMGLARLLHREGPARGWTVTTPAGYLATHSPAHEVELLPESAWSCGHGVARWKADCGCRTGGEPGWNQRWRATLRWALDRLRNEFDRILEEEGGRVLRDVWAARDAYIEVILDGRPETVGAFLARHARHELAPAERVVALELLEMARHALLMYTSCGWFFADLAGIETVQNLRYAARAIELASRYSAKDLEAMLTSDLAAARSNRGEEGDGRRIWERRVRPAQVDVYRVAARWAMGLAAGETLAGGGLYHHAIRPLDIARPVVRGQAWVTGAVALRSELTEEERALGFAVLPRGPYALVCYVWPWPGEAAREGLQQAVEAAPSEPEVEAEAQRWAGRHGARTIRLADLFAEERRAVVSRLTAERLEAWQKACDGLYREAEEAMEALASARMPLPPWLRAVADLRVGTALAAEVEALAAEGGSARLHAIRDLMARARRLGLDPSGYVPTEPLLASLRGLVAEIGREPREADCRRALDLLALAERLGLRLPQEEVQEALLQALHARMPALLDGLASAVSREGYAVVAALLALAERLGLGTAPYRERLRPLEEALAADPSLWP